MTDAPSKVSYQCLIRDHTFIVGCRFRKNENEMKKHKDFSDIENTHEFRERSLKHIRSRTLAFYFLCTPLNGALKYYD